MRALQLPQQGEHADLLLAQRADADTAGALQRPPPSAPAPEKKLPPGL